MGFMDLRRYNLHNDYNLADEGAFLRKSCAGLGGVFFLGSEIMNDEPVYNCVCDKCGKVFTSDKIQTINYQEYPGAGTQQEFVSPCCGDYYDETD